MMNPPGPPWGGMWPGAGMAPEFMTGPYQYTGPNYGPDYWSNIDNPPMTVAVDPNLFPGEDLPGPPGVGGIPTAGLGPTTFGPGSPPSGPSDVPGGYPTAFFDPNVGWTGGPTGQPAPPATAVGESPWGGWGQPAGFFGVPNPPNIGEFGVNAPPIYGGTIQINAPAYAGGPPTTGGPTVPAPGGMGGIYGGGSGGNLGGIGGRLGLSYLQHLMKGIYTTPYQYGEMKGLRGAYGSGKMIDWAHGMKLVDWPSYKDYHANEVYWGNIFRQRGYIYPPQQGSGGGGAGSYGTSSGSAAAQAGMTKQAV